MNITSKFFILLWLLFIFGCQDHSNITNDYVKIKKVDSVLIDLPFDYDLSASFSLQPYRRGDTLFVMLSDLDNKRLIELDVDNGKFSRTIDLNPIKSDYYPVFLFKYFNRDTIIIFRDISNERRSEHDSLLLSVDIDGKYNGHYDLSASPFKMSSHRMDSTSLIWSHGFTPLAFHKRRLFVRPLAFFYNSFNDTQRKSYALPSFGYFDVKASGELDYQNGVYLDEIESVRESDFASNQHLWDITAYDSSSLLFSMGYLSSLYKYDFSTGKLLSSDENNSLLSSPIKVNNGDYDRNFQSTVYTKVLYNRESNTILRFAFLPSSEVYQGLDYAEFKRLNTWLGVYDEDLKLTAQGLRPKWFSLHPKPEYFEGSLISAYQDYGPHSSLKLYFSSIETYQFTEGEYKEYKKRIKNPKSPKTTRDFKDVLLDFNLPRNSIIVIVPGSSCPYCIDHVSSYFLSNYDDMQMENIFLVSASGTLSDEFDASMSPNLLINLDDSIMNRLPYTYSNPTLLYWKDDEIQETMVLNPKEARDIAFYINKFILLKNE